MGYIDYFLFCFGWRKEGSPFCFFETLQRNWEQRRRSSFALQAQEFQKEKMITTLSYLVRINLAHTYIATNFLTQYEEILDEYLKSGIYDRSTNRKIWQEEIFSHSSI